MKISTQGPFDLASTLNSGQVFHWSPFSINDRDGFLGTIFDTPTFVTQTGDEEIFVLHEPTLSVHEPTGLVREATLLVRETDRGIGFQPMEKHTGRMPVPRVASYFGLDVPVAEMRDTFPKNDPFLDSAIAFCPGLRMIRQPLWECLATFITSSLKQVAHIRGISLTLRRRFGKRHEFLGETLFSYPTPEALAEAGELALRDCALGYRAKSLHLTATAIATGEVDLAELDSISDDGEARDFLLQFHGVGEKIANCVLLFGCGRMGAFPIDVWIERVLRKGYRKRVKGAKLQRWAEGYFGPFAGYAQQFLFHYGRVGGLDGYCLD